MRKVNILKIFGVIAIVIIVGYSLLYDFFENYYGVKNDDETYTIVKSDGISRNITIPNTFRKLPVSSIGEQAFCGVDLIDFGNIGLLVPDPLEKINKKYKNENKLPNFSIKKWIFENYTRGKITKVTILAGIIKVDNYAFCYNKIKNLVLPESLEYIGVCAFSFNDLTEIILSPSVNQIGVRAFSGNNIVKITIGEKVMMDITSFDNDFPIFYFSNGRKEGIYNYINGEWSRISTKEEILSDDFTWNIDDLK